MSRRFARSWLHRFRDTSACKRRTM